MGLLEVIGDLFGDKEENIEKHPALNEITIMTYNFNGGFSNDIIKLINRANEDASITIVFNCGKATTNLEQTFCKLFKNINKNIRIYIIANPNTHIKILQLNDILYAGSMNFSSTADSVDKSNLDDFRDSYYNHEILFHFHKGGKDIVSGVIDKLKKTGNSKCFYITKFNYKEQFISHLDYKNIFSKISQDKARKKEIVTSQTNSEMNKFIKTLIEEIVRTHFIQTFGLDLKAMLNNELLQYDDAKKIKKYFKYKSNINDFIETLIDFEFDGAIEDDDGTLKMQIKEYLKNILETRSEELKSLDFNEEKLREEIISKRYDHDNGEGVQDLYGNESEKEFDKRIALNIKLTHEFIVTTLQEISDEIYHEGFYSLPFFTKKIQD